jgi:hypothetical protein
MLQRVCSEAGGAESYDAWSSRLELFFCLLGTMLQRVCSEAGGAESCGVCISRLELFFCLLGAMLQGICSEAGAAEQDDHIWLSVKDCCWDFGDLYVCYVRNS